MIGALAKKTGGARKRRGAAKNRRIPGPGGAFLRWSKSNPKRKKKSGSGVVARATAAKRGTKLKRTKAGVAAVTKAVREKRSKLKGPNALRQKPTAKRRGGLGSVAAKVGGAKRRGGLGSVAAKVAGAKRKPARRKARRGAVRKLF